MRPKSPNRLHRLRFHPDRATARLVVRRVKYARYRDALFPVWRCHPFFTDTGLPVDQADITHRQQAIIETVFADLIDGPLAHLPSGRFGTSSAWVFVRGDRPQPATRRRRSRRNGTPQHAARRYAAAASTSQLAWPAPNTDRFYIYPPTGHGHDIGLHCGAAPSVADHHCRDRLITADTARPERTGKAGQPSGYLTP